MAKYRILTMLLSVVLMCAALQTGVYASDAKTRRETLIKKSEQWTVKNSSTDEYTIGFSKSFTVNTVEGLTALDASVDIDDSFVLYINEDEAKSFNKNEYADNEASPASVGGSVKLDLSDCIGLLNEGENSIFVSVGGLEAGATDISFTMDLVAIYAETETETEGAALYLTADKRQVDKEGDLKLDAYFSEPVNSNTAILTYSFNDKVFAYKNFTASGGVSVLESYCSEGTLRLTVMVSDYKTLRYGEVCFTAREYTDLSDEENSVSLFVEYVEKDEYSNKTIKTVTAKMILPEEGIPGDVNGDGILNLLDLSDIIDVFGIDSAHELWNKYKAHDYNENGSIDIYDITYIAKLIAG